MSNGKIKETLQKNRVFYWEIADKLGVSEVTLCRWLRHDLPEDKQRKILKAITEIVTDRTKL